MAYLTEHRILLLISCLHVNFQPQKVPVRPGPQKESFVEGGLVIVSRCRPSPRRAFFHAPRPAQGGSSGHSVEMRDAVLSATSFFYFQNPSFLSFQRENQEMFGQSNTSTIFGVHQIPSDPQIRNMLDTVSPSHFSPLISGIGNALHTQGTPRSLPDLHQLLDRLRRNPDCLVGRGTGEKTLPVRVL